MTRGFLYTTLLLLSVSSCYSVFIEREKAHRVLRKRANYFLEEIHPGNLERECFEEMCSREEAREIFKSQEKTTEFWYHYKDLSPCKLNPCQNGGICQQYHYIYTCLCPPRFAGRHCENVRIECWYNNGGCLQYCTDTARSLSVSCSCAHGYSLNKDGKSCDQSARYPCGLTISSSRSLEEPELDLEPHKLPLNNPGTTIAPFHQINLNSSLTSNNTEQPLNMNDTAWQHGKYNPSRNITENERVYEDNTTRAHSTNVTAWRQDTNVTTETRPSNESTWVYDENVPESDDSINLNADADKNDQRASAWTGSITDFTEEAEDNSTSDDFRIVGGMRCELGHCPWQVLIRTSRGIDFCGGTLISSRWVLSAAHCFEGINPHHVTIGDYDKLRRDQDEQKIAVLKFFSHPHYLGEYYDHDIALLYLRSAVILNDYARPICLPSPGLGRLLTQEGEIGQVSGWGATRYMGRFSRFLLKVRLPIVSQEVCMASTDKVLTGNMFCAGYSSGARDSCKGDSGGPFAVFYRHTWYLLGVVSWGEGCASEGKYGVYTRVSNYIPWIKETIMDTEGAEEHLTSTL
ncbi:coagulation factor VII-like [Spea bombifrons]|uniref:coagulation factor VII-like n=1 Tax=Spea bombifrons TaxID=233779 RepID=UPI002349F964|nr:coagulation factor VII-like [Spea bombifrons]